MVPIKPDQEYVTIDLMAEAEVLPSTTKVVEYKEEPHNESYD